MCLKISTTTALWSKLLTEYRHTWTPSRSTCPSLFLSFTVLRLCLHVFQLPSPFTALTPDVLKKVFPRNSQPSYACSRLLLMPLNPAQLVPHHLAKLVRQVHDAVCIAHCAQGWNMTEPEPSIFVCKSGPWPLSFM